MNKVEKLLENIEEYRMKIEAQIKKIQSNCEHKNTERYVDYEGTSVQCCDCSYWLRGR